MTISNRDEMHVNFRFLVEFNNGVALDQSISCAVLRNCIAISGNRYLSKAASSFVQIVHR